MLHGLHIGVMWLVSFVCTVRGLDNPVLSKIGFVFGLMSVFHATMLLKAYCRSAEVRSFGIALRMAMLGYLFASLLCALGQYVYMAYFDAGQLMSMVEQTLHSSAYRSVFKDISDAELDAAIALFGDPRLVSLRLFSTNITIGLLMSLPTALIAKQWKRRS